MKPTRGPAPRHGQAVTVWVRDDDQPLNARVDEVEAEALTLALGNPALGDLGGRRGVPAVVEYTSARGVHRLSGGLVGTAVPGILRLERDGHDDVVQRRDYVRVDAMVPIRVTVTDPVRGTARMTTLNISGGGMLLHDPLGLPDDSHVDVEVELAPDSPPVLAHGRVVRRVGTDATGIEIEAIADDDRERLIRYVTERERRALRVARGE